MLWIVALAVGLISTAQGKAEADRFAYRLEMTPEDGPLDPAVQRRYTPRFANCQKHAVKEQENTACFAAEFIRQDVALNRAWKATLHRQSLSGRRPLLTAQRKWIKDRDPFCKSIADSFNGGTIAPVVYANCRVEQTIRRTMWLEILR